MYWRRVRSAAKAAVRLCSSGSAVLSAHERGFALLIVLITLLALSLLWTTVVSGTRQHTQEATSRLAALRLRAALDGALETVAFDVSHPQAPLDLVRTVQVGEIRVEVRVRPEAAKLDLNTADPRLIAAFFKASGVGEVRSLQLAHAIEEARKKGGESVGHATSDVRAGQLETLADLNPKLRDGQTVISCLGDDVTLFTHSGTVAIATASERVRKAAMAYDPALYAAAGTSFFSVVAGEAVRPDILEVTESAIDGPTQIRLTRQVSIRLTGRSERLYWILSDRSPAPSAGETQVACERLAAGSGL